MSVPQKKSYEVPSILLVEVRAEGVICQSGLEDPSDYLPGTDPFLINDPLSFISII